MGSRSRKEEQLRAARSRPGWLARGLPVVAGVGVSTFLCLLILLTAGASTSPLGVPPAWAWILTGSQLLGLWIAGRRSPSGWLIGFVAQPAWIVYALLSGQLGFVPGCAVSAGVHLATFPRQRAEQADRGSARPPRFPEADIPSGSHPRGRGRAGARRHRALSAPGACGERDEGVLTPTTLGLPTPEYKLANNTDSVDTAICRITSRRSSIPCGYGEGGAAGRRFGGTLLLNERR